MSQTESVSAPFSTSFKSALMGSEITWKIDGTKLTKGGRPVIDLANVHSGHWHQTAAKGVQIRTLKLKTDNGTATMAVNGSAGQSSYTNFHKLALTALATTAVHSPNARINVGGGLANMIMTFVLGVALFALGAFCMVMAMGEAPFYIALLGIPFLGLGGMIAFAMRPWNHHRLSIPPAAAISFILDK